MDQHGTAGELIAVSRSVGDSVGLVFSLKVGYDEHSLITRFTVATWAGGFRRSSVHCLSAVAQPLWHAINGMGKTCHYLLFHNGGPIRGFENCSSEGDSNTAT